MFNLKKFQLIKHIVRGEHDKIEQYHEEKLYQEIYNALSQARNEVKTVLVSTHLSQQIRIKTIRNAVWGTLGNTTYRLFTTDHREIVNVNMANFDKMIEHFYSGDSQNVEYVEKLMAAKIQYQNWAMRHNRIINCSEFVTNDGYAFVPNLQRETIGEQLKVNRLDEDIPVKDIEEFATQFIRVLDDAIQNIEDIDLTLNVKQLERNEREGFITQMQNELIQAGGEKVWFY